MQQYVTRLAGCSLTEAISPSSLLLMQCLLGKAVVSCQHAAGSTMQVLPEVAGECARE